MATDFTKLGATRADLEAAGADRLREANEILDLNHFGTAMALGFYALEIHLKVRICDRLELTQLLAAFHTHDLDGLLVLTGLKYRMDSLGIHPVKLNWNFLSSEWKSRYINDLRYKSNSLWSRVQAEDVLRRIQDPTEGVIPWLSAQF